MGKVRKIAGEPGKTLQPSKDANGNSIRRWTNTATPPPLRKPKPEGAAWKAEASTRKAVRGGATVVGDGEPTQALTESARKRNKDKAWMRKRWCKGKEGVDHRIVKEQYTMGGKPYWKWSDCQNCGMSWYRLPNEVKAKYDSELGEQKRLEEKWCGEGHLYETQEVSFTYSNGTYTQKVCVMCGKRKR